MIFEVECDKRNEITDRTDAMFIGNISTDVFGELIDNNFLLVIEWILHIITEQDDDSHTPVGNYV